MRLSLFWVSWRLGRKCELRIAQYGIEANFVLVRIRSHTRQMTLISTDFVWRFNVNSTRSLQYVLNASFFSRLQMLIRRASMPFVILPIIFSPSSTSHLPRAIERTRLPSLGPESMHLSKEWARFGRLCCITGSKSTNRRVIQSCRREGGSFGEGHEGIVCPLICLQPDSVWVLACRHCYVY